MAPQPRFTVPLGEADRARLAELAAHLESSQAEAVRRAIRALHAAEFGGRPPAIRRPKPKRKGKK